VARKSAAGALLAGLLVATVGSVCIGVGFSGSGNWVLYVDPDVAEGELFLDATASFDCLEAGLHSLTGIAGPVYLIFDVVQTPSFHGLNFKSEWVFAAPYYDVSTAYWSLWYFFEHMLPGRGQVGEVARCTTCAGP